MSADYEVGLTLNALVRTPYLTAEPSKPIS